GVVEGDEGALVHPIQAGAGEHVRPKRSEGNAGFQRRREMDDVGGVGDGQEIPRDVDAGAVDAHVALDRVARVEAEGEPRLELVIKMQSYIRHGPEGPG